MQIGDKSGILPFTASPGRYDEMIFRRCGKSGIRLPAISLGLWHNFGDVDIFHHGRMTLRAAFDLGINHFDLANNYGPPYGSAEENFGRMLRKDFAGYRHELFISTKAGYDMWPGPYGNHGSKKYLIQSLDESLARMGLDHVDLFYHHRPDPDTPMEETMEALDLIVRSGKALYVGISNYSARQSEQAIEILKNLGTPLLIHQPRYSMLDRWVENGLLDVLKKNGVGSIVFSPLAQGILTDKYLKGIPSHSRAGKNMTYLAPEQVESNLVKARELNQLAANRGQKLSQMALSWLLKDDRITSVLIGASSVEQLKENVQAVKNITFSREEIFAIDDILSDSEQ